VKANRGAAGIDGVETGDFPAFMREHWEKIRGKLEAGTYVPAPVRRVSIPKDGGGTRSLGIPTVLDRLIQQAIAQVLTPLYEPLFSEHSHGFRPGRSAHDAINEMAEEGRRKGKRCHVVDCDLQAFFDTVDHQKLLSGLRQRVTDPGLLALILAYLKAGVISREGTYEETARGVPQGGPLSPLLANILLDELDDELERRGHKFVRYADALPAFAGRKSGRLSPFGRLVILCGSLRAGGRIMESVRRFLSDKLKLIVNEAKSRVVPLAEAALLPLRSTLRAAKGLAVSLRSAPRVPDRAAQGALDAEEPGEAQIKGKADHQTDAGTLADDRDRRTGDLPSRSVQLLPAWNRVRRGPRTGSLAAKPGATVILDCPARSAPGRRSPDRRARRRRDQQWGRPRTRRRNLMKLGIGREEVKLASRSRKGHPPSLKLWRPGWRMSHN